MIHIAAHPHNSLEQPSNKVPVEPASTILAPLRESLLRLVGQERLLLTIDLVLARVEIGFVGLDALGLHEELVAEDADQVDRDTL